MVGVRFSLILGALAWAYAPSFVELFAKWRDDPQYSHGLLVPIFSLYLLSLKPRPIGEPQSLWAIVLLVVAGVAHATAAMFAFLTLDGIAIILSLAAIALDVGGWKLLRWAAPALIFLTFAVPMPYQVERMLGAELQKIATVAATFLLQCLGLPAVSEGNLILIDEVRLGVAEACSGLRMLTTFVAFAVGAVLLMDRHPLVKAIILTSAVPIALFVNVLRITATGACHVWLHDTAAKEATLKFIHDFNGWLMMPIGLALLLAEIRWLKDLLMEVPPDALRYA